MGYTENNGMIRLDQRYKLVLEDLARQGQADSIRWIKEVYNNSSVDKIQHCITVLEKRITTNWVGDVLPSVLKD